MHCSMDPFDVSAENDNHFCNEENDNKHHVLILGAGFVSQPLIKYLSTQKDIVLTVASVFQHEIDKIRKCFSKEVVSVIMLDVNTEVNRLDEVIKLHHVVVSLLPYGLHPHIASYCIKHKKHMVTSSYVTSIITDMEKMAIDAGIFLVMECGLDPGIDHCLAAQCFDDIKGRGGKIKSYVSWCGGLPAPESSNVPLRYKFSWSPKGVLLASQSPSKFLLNGEIIAQQAETNFSNVLPIKFMPELDLIGIPNRNSIDYMNYYGLHDAKTVLRGTLRYRGFAEVVLAFNKLGLLDASKRNLSDCTWRKVIMNKLEVDAESISDSGLNNTLLNFIGNNVNALTAIKDLGFLDQNSVISAADGSLLDALANHLSHKLKYNDGERDMVLMKHEIIGEFSGVEEKHDIEFTLFGDTCEDGFSAMAKSVGFTCGLAVRTLLDKGFANKQSGIITPLTEDLYLPLLHGLKSLGLTWTKTVS